LLRALKQLFDKTFNVGIHIYPTLLFDIGVYSKRFSQNKCSFMFLLFLMDLNVCNASYKVEKMFFWEMMKSGIEAKIFGTEFRKSKEMKNFQTSIA